MSKVERRLPSVKELRSDARAGRLVDRVESYLPDSLYHATSVGKASSNGRARKTGTGTGRVVGKAAGRTGTVKKA